MKVFQRLVICIEDKLFVKKVMPPMLYGLNHRVKLHVVCVVPSSRAGEFLTKESDWLARLAQNSPYTNLRRITVQLKGL